MDRLHQLLDNIKTLFTQGPNTSEWLSLIMAALLYCIWLTINMLSGKLCRSNIQRF
jgi:hypothetical protein